MDPGSAPLRGLSGMTAGGARSAIPNAVIVRPDRRIGRGRALRWSAERRSGEGRKEDVDGRHKACHDGGGSGVTRPAAGVDPRFSGQAGGRRSGVAWSPPLRHRRARHGDPCPDLTTRSTVRLLVSPAPATAVLRHRHGMDPGSAPLCGLSGMRAGARARRFPTPSSSGLTGGSGWEGRFAGRVGAAAPKAETETWMAGTKAGRGAAGYCRANVIRRLDRRIGWRDQVLRGQRSRPREVTRRWQAQVRLGRR